MIARPTTEGFVATDDTTYPTLAALLAAGKTAFPGLEAQGIYPQAVVMSSVAAAGGAAGDYFEFTDNSQTAPSHGIPVFGSGQQFVLEGIQNQSGSHLIQSIYVCNKKTASDIIECVAIYEG